MPWTKEKIRFLTSAALKIIYKQHNENKHTRGLIFEGLPHVEPPGVPFSKGRLGGERLTCEEKTPHMCRNKCLFRDLPRPLIS